MQEHLVVDSQPHIKNSLSSFFKRNFNTNLLTLSLIIAFFLSLPIYLYSLSENFFIQIINFIFIFLGFLLFINQKHSFFLTGFFIGIFWFWWISLSFRYYNLTWLIPFVIFLIGIGYGIIFWGLNKIFTFFKFSIFNFSLSVYLWALFIIFGFDYIRPFTFDWLKPEVLLATTFLLPTKLMLFIFIFSILLINISLKYKKIFRGLGFFSLILGIILLQKPQIPMPNLKINLISTYIPQNKKWNKNYIPIEINNNFKYIQTSIKKHYDVVVLPESAFPLFLNLHPFLMLKLLNLSKKITIVTGALHYKNKKFYNSTYIFENGKVKILDKHVLVPFGEYIPFPFFQKEINKIFFNGASDYKTSKKFGIFKIKNYKFINAICYEATIEKLYTLKPHYIIAMSNMAWFMPSIAPIIQKLLIKVYAIKYKKIVFHSLNGYKSYIIKG